MTADHGPVFSVQDIPFSTFGSWLALSPVTALHSVSEDIHLVSHQTGMHPVLRLVPRHDGEAVKATVTARPGLLSWNHGDGRMDATFEAADTLRLRGRGLGLRLSAAAAQLTPFSGTYFLYDPIAGAFVFTSYETGRRYRITPLVGTATQHDGSQALGAGERGVTFGEDGLPWEVAVEEYQSSRTRYVPAAHFDDTARLDRQRYDAFVDDVAPWRSSETPAAALAAYVMWSATVGPAGFLRRPSVLMSKHWMDKVWSWDHCFNALALGEGRPALAWDQYQLPFDHQDEAGALPDSVAHSEVLYNFVKPPIHGWALRMLRGTLKEPLGRAELETAYRQLERWTNFWTTFRTAPGSNLPHYQHGNDSGWDNSTSFDRERVIESADLTAFLVLQIRELAETAAELGRHDDAARHASAADRLLENLLENLWKGDHFVSRSVQDGRTWGSSSLLNLMPIVLGAELPVAVSTHLAQKIQAHLTDFGLATEDPKSPLYQADGYWRGPIWAPSTLLVEDGLRRAGHVELADEVSLRFRGLCENHGFAENFDAVTGEGLRDRAYTWTASVYLVLAAAHARRC
ncbi:glycogen debranching enzyme [Kitasatospora gansuensis]|uniref:Glycogen debranching enzyme n=1 Tax=Kitasatospora gansuensis TaxID=258050 RepID=A0A7W7S9W9_9ACTN|nr:trehalase family glycosidase [Kitasatospora gansuensis]MBB4945968.1 glycogen debranching enzyme [Kitasatospora gansuensis]